MSVHIYSRSPQRLKAPAMVWFGDVKEFPPAWAFGDRMFGLQDVVALYTRGDESVPEPALFTALGVTSKVKLFVSVCF